MSIAAVVISNLVRFGCSRIPRGNLHCLPGVPRPASRERDGEEDGSPFVWGIVPDAVLGVFAVCHDGSFEKERVVDTNEVRECRLRIPKPIWQTIPNVMCKVVQLGL